MVIVTVTLNTSIDRTVEVPRLVIGGHLRGRLVRVQAAGKGVNVSRCLASLGVPSAVTGFVGARELPLFAQSLAASPASVQLVPVADATRTNTTLLDPELGTETHVREAGFQVRPDEFEALRVRLGGLSGPEVVCVFCGSLPPGITEEHLATLMAACRDAGAQVGADLSGPPLAVAVQAEPLLIKPNLEELGELLRRDLASATEAGLAEAVGGLCGRVGTVLVTRGRLGAVAVRAGGALAARAETGAVRNTVGCGDAFLAGYLAGLWRNASFEECLRRAGACGTASALTDAAGEIEPRRVAELAALTQVRRLA